MDDLYKWKKHDSRLKARIKDSDSVRKRIFQEKQKKSKFFIPISNL
jgi:hypothetical protein